MSLNCFRASSKCSFLHGIYIIIFNAVFTAFKITAHKETSRLSQGKFSKWRPELFCKRNLNFWRPVTLLKTDSNTFVFQWKLWSFWEELFWKKSANDCFWVLKENFTVIIFFFFCLNWPRMGLYKSIYKMDFFSSKIHISAPFTQNIYMTFYLRTWKYFNDVKTGGRNILVNSQLKRILFMSSNKKTWHKTERRRK